MGTSKGCNGLKIFIFLLEPTFVLATNLSGDQTSYQFGGLSLAEVYSVSLTCVFGGDQFDCGTVSVSTSPPDLVQPGHVTTHVYSVDNVARTWHEAEHECVASGGPAGAPTSWSHTGLLLLTSDHITNHHIGLNGKEYF